MEHLRLFWAINLPVSLKSKLAALQEELKSIPANVKWVEKENLHLTLKFLGNVKASLVPELVDSVQKGLDEIGPFNLEIGSLGFFPNDKRPRVLWVGLKGDLTCLQLIYKIIEETHLSFGFPVEKRSFSPHLTLARLRSSQGIKDLLSKMNRLSDEVAYLEKIQVISVDLMKSKLSRFGPEYTVLARVKLKGRNR